MSANMPAVHLIGYTDGSCSQGLAGIEREYQEILSSGNSVYALATTDAKDKFIQRYGYQLMKTESESPLSIKLTLDYHMQKLAEEVMDKMMVSGAVVIIDILNGDVLVLASRPGFNPADISQYLNDNTQPLFNRALAGYTPGSIFKIISTAAALEDHYDTEIIYDCPGYYPVGDQIFKCWSYDIGGHGMMDLKTALRNPAMDTYPNGYSVGAENARYSKELGLGSVQGWMLRDIRIRGCFLSWQNSKERKHRQPGHGTGENPCDTITGSWNGCDYRQRRHTKHL